MQFEEFDLDKAIEKIKSFELEPRDLYWYSANKIIHELYNIPSSFKIDVYPYHGIYVTDYELSPYAFDFKNTVLCTRQSQVDYLIENGRSADNTFCSGALFPLYRRLKCIEPDVGAKGTIVFPSHSSLEFDKDVSYTSYIAELKKLPESFYPLNICMYWLDILKGRHKLFIENGFNVYTAGHSNDPDFVDNFYEILRHHKYATSNSFSGSNLLYAVEFGMPTFIYADESLKNIKEGENFSHVGADREQIKAYTQVSLEFFKNNFPKYPNIEMSNMSKNKVLSLLGLDYKTPRKIVSNRIIREYYSMKLNKYVKRIKHYFYKKTKDGKYYKIRILGCLNFKLKIPPKKYVQILKNTWTELENKSFNEFKTSSIVKSLNSDSVCIDCGANVGLITEIFADKGASVYSFEPHKGCFEVLKKKFASNPKVHLYNKGVLDRNTKMKLYKFEYHDYDELFFSQGASIYNSNLEVDSNTYDEIDVINLVDFIKELNKPIDILKMDIEGAEFAILELLIKEGLYKNIGHILVETHDEVIPEIKDQALRVRNLIKEKDIKNIDLTWV